MKLSLLQSIIDTDVTIHDANVAIAELEHLEAIYSVLFNGCEMDDSKLRAMCAPGLQIAFRWKVVNDMKKTATVIPANMNYCDTLRRWVTDVDCALSPRDTEVQSEYLKKEMTFYERIQAVGRSSMFIRRMKLITQNHYRNELTAGNKRDASNMSGNLTSIGSGSERPSFGSTSGRSSVSSSNGSRSVIPGSTSGRSSVGSGSRIES